MRATLYSATFDVPAGRFSGVPHVELQGAQHVDYIDVSPDGRWLTFGTADRQEDLFLVRADGSGFRQLTDDVHRDRGPRWSPDGTRLAFYSNRQGPYALWSIRPDGSRLELLARSPQGHSLVRRSGRRTGSDSPSKENETGRLALVDLKKPFDKRIEPVPETAGAGYVPQAWSADGRLLAMNVDHGSGASGVYLHAVGGVRTVHTAGAQLSEGALAWLPDSRQLLLTTRESGIQLLDTRTGTVREVSPRPRGLGQISVISVSSDGRTVAFVELRTEGDLWTMERRGNGR